MTASSWRRIGVLLCVASLVTLWHYRPFFYLWQAERELNCAYASLDPFPYRWAGTPAPQAEPGRKCSIKPITSRLDRLESKLADYPAWMRVRSKAALIDRDPGTAIKLLLRAQTRSPGDATVKSELAVAYALRADWQHRDSDYEIALEFAEGAVQTVARGNAVAHFNLAMIAEAVPLTSVAAEEWREAAALEHDADWLAVCQKHWRSLDASRAQRKAAIEYLKNPVAVDSALLRLNGACEQRQSAAIRNWIRSRDMPMQALAQLAEAFARIGDSWWRDFLGSRSDPKSRALLSEAEQANDEGRHTDAARLSAEAEKAFAHLGNDAGRLWARRLRIQASYRGQDARPCLDLLRGYDSQTRARSYLWLNAQGLLDGITCRTVIASSPSLEERRAARSRISQYQLEGATLRAVAFLTEPWVGADTPSRIWALSRDGLQRFENSVVPGYRAYHFAWNLSQAAEIAGDFRAECVLLREGILQLEGEENRGVTASALGDLAVAESHVGLHREAAEHMQRAARLVSTGRDNQPAMYEYQLRTEQGLRLISEGRPLDAIRLLKPLSETAAPNPMDEASLLGALGWAHLRAGHYAEADGAYGEVIEREAKLLREAPPAERESLTRVYDSAVRGIVEARQRAGASPEKTLWTWLSYRQGRWRSAPRVPSLQPGEFLLAYAALDGGLSAWMADANGVQQRWIDGAEARTLTAQLGSVITDPQAPEALIRQIARRLDRLLINPFAARLNVLTGPGSRKLLFVDGDDLLAPLPWPVLEDETGKSLIERYSIVRTFGAPQSNEPAGMISGATRAAVFADPVVDASVGHFEALPEAASEGRRIAERFQAPLLATGAQATRGLFFRAAQNAEVLHFAGHGISNGGFGGLVLSGEDGVITAPEISGLDMSRMKLVVLSSCASGIGPETGKLNADLLVRGFLRAGAQRVLAASWDVGSLETAELVDHFYDGMLAGAPAASALRSAALAARSSGARVSVWAAFQLYGAP